MPAPCRPWVWHKGHRVMLYIPNCVQWVIAFLGIQKLGAVVVPVAPIYTSHEIIYMIKDAGVETVVCMDTNFCYVKEALAETDLKRVIVTNLTDLLPAWKTGDGPSLRQDPHGKSGCRTRGCIVLPGCSNTPPGERPQR